MRTNTSLAALLTIREHILLAQEFAGSMTAAALGAGNLYRHEYDDVAEEPVLNTIGHSLPSLLDVVEFELSASKPPSSP